MTLSLVDAVRINNSTWAWSSVALSIDGNIVESLVGIDYEDRLDLRIVQSNVQDQPPLGMSLGRYQVGAFPLRMLRDGANALKKYLTAKAPAALSGSYGQATFDMILQLSEHDASDSLPSTTAFANCRIIAERQSYEEGIDAAITEFVVACLAIVQDGNSLFDGTGLASSQMPWADTITIGGLPAPGKWTLLRAPKPFGWEERKGYALAGATVVPTGDPLVRARFLVEIWTPIDYVAFRAFRSLYLKKQLVSVAGSPQGLALGIDHPELKELGATSFVPLEVNPLINDGWGVGVAEVEFLQFRRPLPALSKPDAAIPDAGTPRPTALNQTEIEIQKLEAEVQALAGP